MSDSLGPIRSKSVPISPNSFKEVQRGPKRFFFKIQSGPNRSNQVQILTNMSKQVQICHTKKVIWEKQVEIHPNRPNEVQIGPNRSKRSKLVQIGLGPNNSQQFKTGPSRLKRFKQVKKKTFKKGSNLFHNISKQVHICPNRFKYVQLGTNMSKQV